MSQPLQTCTHIHDTGGTCNSIADKNQHYCVYHLRHRARLMRMAQARARSERFDLKLPPLESMHAVQSALTQLMGVLPDGYDSSNCAVVDNPPRDSLATIDCDDNSLPNGPTAARFSLYPDVATLDAHFQTAAGEDQIKDCPGGVASPGTWHYTNSPDTPAGKLVCGTYEGTPDLVWSQNDKLLLGNLQGTDLQSIYDFWSNNTA